MANMITRTVTTWKASAFKIAWKKGQPIAELIGEVEYIGGGSESKTDARAALKAAGVNTPRGTEIVIEKVAETLYGMEMAAFMAAATPIERKANEQ